MLIKGFKGPTHLRDEKFLNFFFKRLEINSTEEYHEFPYVSKCMGEFNFMRAADTPIVFIDIKGKITLFMKCLICKQNLRVQNWFMLEVWRFLSIPTNYIYQILEESTILLQ